MNNRFKILLFCALSIAFIGCDRVTKDLAKTHLMNKPDISYFHNTIRLEYVENTGAALSLGDDLPKIASFWLLSILPLTAMLILLVYFLKHSAGMNFMRLLSIALIFSGGLGNVIDRIVFDRHVTDFMNIGILSLRTGIFNFADVCVTAGAIGFIFSYQRNRLNLQQ